MDKAEDFMHFGSVVSTIPQIPDYLQLKNLIQGVPLKSFKSNKIQISNKSYFTSRKRREVVLVMLSCLIFSAFPFI